MRVSIKRQNEAVHFRGENEEGQSLDLDGIEKIGGAGKGMRPMEILLSSLAGCSALDVVSILKKQKQEIEVFDIEIEGEREKINSVTPFKSIHLNFILKGKIEQAKAKRAVELSIEKYCSVKASLNPNIEITYSVEVHS